MASAALAFLARQPRTLLLSRRAGRRQPQVQLRGRNRHLLPAALRCWQPPARATSRGSLPDRSSPWPTSQPSPFCSDAPKAATTPEALHGRFAVLARLGIPDGVPDLHTGLHRRRDNGQGRACKGGFRVPAGTRSPLRDPLRPRAGRPPGVPHRMVLARVHGADTRRRLRRDARCGLYRATDRAGRMQQRVQAAEGQRRDATLQFRDLHSRHRRHLRDAASTSQDSRHTSPRSYVVSATHLPTHSPFTRARPPGRCLSRCSWPTSPSSSHHQASYEKKTGIIVDDNIPFIKGRLEPFADTVYADQFGFTPELVRDADAMVIRTRTRCDENLLKGSKVKIIATATIGVDPVRPRMVQGQRHNVPQLTGMQRPRGGAIRPVGFAPVGLRPRKAHARSGGMRQRRLDSGRLGTQARRRRAGQRPSESGRRSVFAGTRRASGASARSRCSNAPHAAHARRGMAVVPPDRRGRPCLDEAGRAARQRRPRACGRQRRAAQGRGLRPHTRG